MIIGLLHIFGVMLSCDDHIGLLACDLHLLFPKFHEIHFSQTPYFNVLGFSCTCSNNTCLEKIIPLLIGKLFFITQEEELQQEYYNFSMQI